MIERNPTETSIEVSQATSNRPDRIDPLHLQSRRNLWELLLFLLLSIAAVGLQQTNLHQVFSEAFRQILGMPLPASLLSLALAAYVFSAVVQMLSRQRNDTSFGMRSFHLLFRSIFYLFYAFSGALAEHFVFVFASGLLLYGLEQANIWVRLSKQVEEEPELVEER